MDNVLCESKRHTLEDLGMKIIDLFDGTKGKLNWKNKQKQSWRLMFKARALVFSLHDINLFEEK